MTGDSLQPIFALVCAFSFIRSSMLTVFAAVDVAGTAGTKLAKGRRISVSRRT
jgi:hypothetical protein